MRKLITLLCFLPVLAHAQIPSGYYNPAQGLSGTNLLIALHNIIDNHTVVSYGNLFTCYLKTDKKSNGKVWDIYTDIPGGTPVYSFNFGSDQCGNYAVEGDCFNREHTWPQSWFNSLTPAVSDLFHVYPTDGKVNGERDNYPYGNVNSAVYVSSNGSQLGYSSDLGFSSVVFEPIDEYKGDVARNYFYMSTRYYSEDNSWTNSSATNKSTILPWELNVLLNWHHQDPVSAKEIARNDTIYKLYQHNRNPFIDHPEWADSIWAATVQAFVTAVHLDEHEAPNSISLFPNPTNESIYLKMENPAQEMKIEITDINGKRIDFDLSPENELIRIDFSSLEKGVYFIKLIDDKAIRNLNFIKY